MDDELSYGVYELRWKSRSETNPSKSITLPVTSDHEFFQYSKVDLSVVFCLRLKKAYEDRFPYFFWCQESDPTICDRFLIAVDLCMKKMQKERKDRNEFERRKPMNLNEFMKKRHVETILNDEAICKRLYPLVPPCLRSPAGLKRIMSSPSFHKNVSIFQDLVNNLGIDSSAELYGVDISDLQVDNSSLDSGVKSYVSRIEKWAKDKLEEEKRE